MVALSLAELPGNTDHIVLAMGGLDNMVHLYCGVRKGKVCNCEVIFHFLFYPAHDPFLRNHKNLNFFYPVYAQL